MLKYTVFLFAFNLFFISCKKDETKSTNDADFKLAPNAYIIDVTTGQALVSVDSTKVFFNGNTEQLKQLKSGDVIVSGVQPNAPYGFLRKITKLTQTGNEYAIETREASLTEAFEELDVDYNYTFSESDIAGRKSGAGININMPNLILKDIDGNLSTINDQIKWDGNINLVPDVTVKIRIRNFKLEYAKLGGTFVSDINRSISIGGNLASLNSSLTLLDKPLGIINIPFTPIVIVPTISIKVGAYGSISAQLSYDDQTTSTSGAYVEYADGNWKPSAINEVNSTSGFNASIGNASAKAYVKPAINFKFFGSNWAKGSLYVEGYASFEAQLSPCKPCEIKAGIEGGIEANLSFFSYDFVEAKYPDIINISKIIYQCGTDICNTESSFTDPRDGQTYKTVKIGNQIWFAENLRYAGSIPNITDSIQWSYNVTTPAWCYYDNKPIYNSTLGKLYNWYAVESGNICPNGWHLPNEDEWNLLANFLGGKIVAGDKMKSTTGWQPPNTVATNSSGFNSLSGGIRSNNRDFENLGTVGYWWSTTLDGPSVRLFFLMSSTSELYSIATGKEFGLSCRCLKD